MSDDSSIQDDMSVPVRPESLSSILGVSEDDQPWMGRSDWGPSHMLNDLGPATVELSEDVIQAEKDQWIVQRAVDRAIETGEEYEYDD